MKGYLKKKKQKTKETDTVNWNGLISILIDLSNVILIYLSKTCLDQRPLDLCMKKLHWFRNNFFLAKTVTHIFFMPSSDCALSV